MSHIILSAWYANPVSTNEAECILVDVRSKLKHPQDSTYLQLRLQEITARYWLGRDISGDVENLQATCKDEACRALVNLIYGQLLISCKLQGAMAHLQQGFQQATNLFEAAEYLEVMRRHERLKNLLLTNRPAKAMPLDDLLKEADIIKKLRGKAAYHCDIRADGMDTVG